MGVTDVPSKSAEERTSSEDLFGWLPDDVAWKVLGHIDGHQDLVQASQTSKRLKELSANDTLWEHMYTKRFPNSRSARQSERARKRGHSREQYRWRWGVDQAWRRNKRELLHSMEHHRAWVNAVRISPAAGVVVSAGTDQDVIIWGMDGTPRHLLHSHSHNVWCVDCGASLAVSGGFDGMGMVWDVQSGRFINQLQLDAYFSVQLLEGEQGLLTGHASGRIVVWDLRTGGIAQQLHILGAAGEEYPQGEHEDLPRALGRCNAYSARCEGHLVAAGGECWALSLYDLRRCAKTACVRAHAGPIYSLDVQGPRIATGSKDCNVMLWDTAKLAAGSGASSGSQADPGGYGGAVPSRRGTRPPRGALLGVGQGHGMSLFGVRLTPDWRLVTGSEDGSVRLWDAGQAPQDDPEDGRRAGPAWRDNMLQEVWSFSPGSEGTPRLEYCTLSDAAPSSSMQGVAEPRLSASAVHDVDATDGLLAVAGRDAIVRLYSLDPQRGAFRSESHRTD